MNTALVDRGGWWLRVKRGHQHLDGLKSEALAWISNYEGGRSPWRSGKTFDADLNCFTYVVESIDLPPLGWSLLIGDILHYFLLV